MDHSQHLTELVNNLHEIHEDRSKIHWVMREGIWYNRGTHHNNQFSDLVLVFFDGYGVPIELKGVRHKRNDAMTQLESTRCFITDVLGMPCPYGRFVVYGERPFYSERIGFQ